MDFDRLIKTLLTTTVVQELVEVFFKEANWYFAVLDQFYFDRLHLSWITLFPNLSNAEEAT